MAKKRTTKKVTEPTTESEPRAVRLELPADLHDLLRLVAASDRKSMTAWMRDLAEHGIREAAKRKGFK